VGKRHNKESFVMEPSEPSSPGKSLIEEVERLREAVLRLCDLQQELALRVEAALQNNHPINGGNATPAEGV
jgi:hypothetical protein